MERFGYYRMVTIIMGATRKPVSSERLTDFFGNRSDWDGCLYIGYPVIGTVNGRYPIDALFISRLHGLIVFNLIEGTDSSELKDYDAKQDDSYNKMEAKLKGYRELVDRRRLCVDINVITFAPAVNIRSVSEIDGYPLCDEGNLQQTISQCSWDYPEYYEKLVSVLQAISTIRKGVKKREIVNSASRGAKLKELEDSIANLDDRQGKAVIETVNGVQRIRGLAGSGKTIVLALKAAYLHAQNPDWRIAVTFNTRSLKGQFKRLITTFYIEQTNEEPDWEKLQIMHAWGAPGGGDKDGIYYTYCIGNGIDYLDYATAKNKFGRMKTFSDVCDKAITEQKGENVQIYDALLVDEAQDFSPSFLNICYELLKEPKRLVYAYDELQNLSSQSLPPPETIFGVGKNGLPRVKFFYDEEGKSKQDRILKKCYRNSKHALVTAHALGFGIYRRPDPELGTGLVQIFEQNSLWKEIGYQVEEGALENGRHVVLARTKESSPEFLQNHSPEEDLVFFQSFATKQEQARWIADQILKNLLEEELRPDDIIVINPNPISTRDEVGPIRSLLAKEEIPTHTAGVDTSPDVFFDVANSSVAFTGIYRAKGNEAAMVYVMNAQDCYGGQNDTAIVRNRLFTAITRSKAWVRILGVGNEMDLLMEEYEKVKNNDYKLNFYYPTEEQKKYLNIVNRDMSDANRKKIQKARNSIEEVVSGLKNKEIYPEDFNKEQLSELISMLKEAEEHTHESN